MPTPEIITNEKLEQSFLKMRENDAFSENEALAELCRMCIQAGDPLAFTSWLNWKYLGRYE